MLDQVTRQIICTAFDKGRVHDASLVQTISITDVLHSSVMPSRQGPSRHYQTPPLAVAPQQKSPAKQNLQEFEREHNRLLTLNSEWWLNTLIDGVAIFRILAERYRNRRRCFGVCVLT